MKRACFHKNTNKHENINMRVPSGNLKTNYFRMKRTCLQKNTNTDKQNSCEFHSVKPYVKEPCFNPTGTQQVKSFVLMKRNKFIALLKTMLLKSASIIHPLWWTVIPFLLYYTLQMFKFSMFTPISL